MYGGHETLDEAKLVVDDLSEGSQAVGSARGVRDDGCLGVVGVEVDTNDVHGCVGRGCRDDDLLGTTLNVGRGFLGGGEDTGGLDDIVGTDLPPRDLGGVSLGEDGNGLAVYDKLSVLCSDVTLEEAVSGVVCSARESGMEGRARHVGVVLSI